MLATTERAPLNMPSLHPAQVEILESPARFKVVAAGAQFGKSMLASGMAVSTAARGGHVWWVYPDHPLASIGWDYLTGLCEQIPYCSIHEQDRIVRFSSGGFVQIKSTGQTLRGRPLDLAIFDECAFSPEDSWERQLAPRLSTRLGKAMFISTPDGYNWFHTLWERGNDPNFPEWQSWQIPTSANPFIDPSEIEKAKHRLDPSAFAQEYEAQFVLRSGAVFGDFSRARHVAPTPYDPALPVYMGVDFGYRVFAAVLFQIDKLGVVRVIADSEYREMNTQAAMLAMYSIPLGNGKPYTEHVEIIGCDPAGDARSSSAQVAGWTDVDGVRKAWPKSRVLFSTDPKHRSPEWRASQIRALLKNAAGETRIVIDPSCKRTIRMFENSVYPEHKDGKPMGQEPVKDGVVDHIRDALGYGLVNTRVFGRVGAEAARASWL